MVRIARVVVPNALMLLACSVGYVFAAETHVLTQEEFKEQVRQYEAGKFLEKPRIRPATAPKAVEQYERAVALHGKKGASASELKEAASLYQAASDAGIPQASTNLALLYLEGKGVKKNVKKALSLLNLASKKNIPEADIALARLYLTGTDVKRDEKKGERHLNKAAKAGNQNAVKMLAEYKEWKKKNDLAMKQYQEIMKNARMNQINPQAITAQPSTGLPLQPAPPELPFPLIPGQSSFGLNQIVTPAVPPTPAGNVVPKGDTVVPQPGKPTTVESIKEKTVIQTPLNPAGQEQGVLVPGKSGH